MNRSASFPPAAASSRAARAFVVEALPGIDPGILQSVILMVSELTSNAVRHAKATFAVAVERADGAITIRVTDDGPGWPTPRRPGAQEPSGRGLLLVDELSDAWGIEDHPLGKSVWARMHTHRDEQRPRGASADVGAPSERRRSPRNEAVPPSSATQARSEQRFAA